jgi:hypothetical protein
MGDFGMGRMMAVTGKSILDDANAFARNGPDTEPRSSDYRFSASAGTMPAPKATNLASRLLEKSSSMSL